MRSLEALSKHFQIGDTTEKTLVQSTTWNGHSIQWIEIGQFWLPLLGLVFLVIGAVLYVLNRYSANSILTQIKETSITTINTEEYWKKKHIYPVGPVFQKIKEIRKTQKNWTEDKTNPIWVKRRIVIQRLILELRDLIKWRCEASFKVQDECLINISNKLATIQDVYEHYQAFKNMAIINLKNAEYHVFLDQINQKLPKNDFPKISQIDDYIRFLGIKRDEDFLEEFKCSKSILSKRDIKTFRSLGIERDEDSLEEFKCSKSILSERGIKTYQDIKCLKNHSYKEAKMVLAWWLVSLQKNPEKNVVFLKEGHNYLTFLKEQLEKDCKFKPLAQVSDFLNPAHSLIQLVSQAASEPAVTARQLKEIGQKLTELDIIKHKILLKAYLHQSYCGKVWKWLNYFNPELTLSGYCSQYKVIDPSRLYSLLFYRLGDSLGIY